MTKIGIFKFSRISAILIVLIISSSFIDSYDEETYDFTAFKTKSYYNDLFNIAQKSVLSEADQLYLKGEAEMSKAEENFRKADGYKKMDENYGSNSSKKSDKYRKKGNKYALNAYNYYLNAINKKFRVYSERLEEFENNNSKKHLKAEELSIKARELFLNGSEIIRNEDEKNKDKAVKTYKDAFNIQTKALQMQERAFMLFMNDPEIKYDEKNDKIISDNDEDNNVTDNDDNKMNPVNNDYEPGKDPNLYVSKEESIIAELEITDQDRSKLDDAKDKRGYADILTGESDQEYNKIDRIRDEAESTDDEYERDLKLKMAAGLEDVLMDKMIKAADMYYEADKIKYEVYNKYLPSARNSGSFEKGQKHEKNAEKLFTDASRIYNKTMFYSDHKTSKYIQLMNAVQTQLSAIQEQENAFSVYFNFEVIPVNEGNKTADNDENITNGKSKDDSGEFLYNYSASYYYTADSPNPQPLQNKEGIIFKVQVGLFKNLLPLNRYGKYSPISYDTFINNPYKRFFLGEYRSYKSAEYVLNNIKTKGLTDPFIVAFIDGTRKSATYGLSQIIRDDEFEKIEKDEMGKLTGNVLEGNNEMNASESIKNVKNITGLAYYIQLGSFSEQKSKTDFQNIQQLYTDNSSSTFKYMTGIYRSYDESKKDIEKIKSYGFPEAFVVAYNKGAKISLEEASELSGNTDNNINTNKSEIFFSVQIGVFSKILTEEEIAKFKPVPDKYKILHKTKDSNLYVYYIGEYDSYEKANEVKNDVKSMGQDGFVIAFQNGKKISAQKAIELLKN